MLDERAKHLRRQVIEVLRRSGRGHLGPALSIIDILRVLYDDVLRPDDKFILSKGHGCIALYVMLADKGYFPEKHLWEFCRFDALLGGHPEKHIPGVEISTGSLGHGLSVAVGMAIAIKPRRVFVLLGDGECDEGSVWEAAMCASKHKLDNLTVLVDYNQQQSYGSTHEVMELEPLAAKWKAFGFLVWDVNPHELRVALSYSQIAPTAIICNTIKTGFHHKNAITEADLARYLP